MKPNFRYFKVCGCFAKVGVPPTKKRKVEPKTIDCIFIGYAQHNVAYKFIVIKSTVNGIDSPLLSLGMQHSFRMPSNEGHTPFNS